MKTKLKPFQAWVFSAVALGMGSSFNLAAAAENAADPAPERPSAVIAWSQIGAKAGADYQGDGLAVIPTAQGARLRCVFQRLEGDATREGLWLTSTLTNAVNERFRVVAAQVGRVTPCAPPGGASVPASRLVSSLAPPTDGAHRVTRPTAALPNTGTVSLDGQIVHFNRPGLVEEYTVSIDGVRQDFVVRERPTGNGELAVRLAVSGAKVELAADGARLVLETSGRRIAYSRLHATDATGKELTTRMEVLSVGDEVTSLESNAERGTRNVEVSQSLLTSSPTDAMLVVVVNDADAVYPVRIDPTFSDANWISMGGIPGANGTVSEAVVDGSGNLYIGGSFTIVGDVVANHIAKWNGSRWSPLGSGVNGSVTALAVSGSDVYAGAGSWVAKWNGSSWSALGLGMNNSVLALAVLGSHVYAGGAFTEADGSAVNYIAKWNGSSWSPLFSGMNNYVQALVVSGSDVYAGGGFTVAGGTAANYIARWNGSSWSALGSGIAASANDSRYVSALAVSGSNVYVGGTFNWAGSGPANRVAKWDGSSWSPLGSGLNGVVTALAVSGSNVYAGGYFTTAGGSAATNIAKWDGSSWSALGSGMSGYYPVSALAVSGSDVYAGGNFSMAGGSVGDHIARWNGSSWSALGSRLGMNNEVSALAVSGSDVYAGGSFTTAGGSPANCIAKWNGSRWSALGSGIGGATSGYPPVSALAVSGSDVYAGGNFTTAGGSAATNIAKWNGSNWSPLGSGLNGVVFALAVSGSDVYVGGFFSVSDGVPVSVAKWNGSSWSEVGSLGYSGRFFIPYVYALAVLGSDLYAGGQFSPIYGAPAPAIARWNGSSWTGLGSGIGGTVFALAVSGSNVYAGGAFTTAGGGAADSIAKWNGSSWTALGSGIGGTVSALAVSGSNVYAGGYFTAAGGVAATNIAKWNGSSWTALGSGMGGDYPSVSALAVAGSDLYAGGRFTTAGGKVSVYMARAYLLPLPELSMLRSGMEVMVSWPSVDTAGFVLEQAATLAAPTSWITNSANVTDDGINKSVTLPATNSAQFFRLRGP